MNRLQRHLAWRLVGHVLVVWLVLAAVAAALLATADAGSRLPTASPWLAGPVGLLLAAWATRHRTSRLGEDVAAAAGGASPWTVAGPAVALGAALALLPSLPDPAGPEPVAATPPAGRVVVGLDGTLWLPGATRPAVWFDAAGTLHEGASPATRPAGFVATPRSPWRLRGQRYVLRSPLHGGDHPLDPQLWRWLTLAVAVAGAWGLLAAPARRARQVLR